MAAVAIHVVLKRQLDELRDADVARQAWNDCGVVAVAGDRDEGAQISDAIAPSAARCTQPLPLPLPASVAAEHVGHWEIIDYGSAAKPDAPSGTSRELAERLETVHEPAPAEHDAELT